MPMNLEDAVQMGADPAAAPADLVPLLMPG
jgi:hypothetical protein